MLRKLAVSALILGATILTPLPAQASGTALAECNNAGGGFFVDSFESCDECATVGSDMVTYGPWTVYSCIGPIRGVVRLYVRY